MSNFSSKLEKLQTRIESLQRKHRKLDEQIKKEFDNFVNDSKINNMKLEKYNLKDQIHKLQLQIVSLEAQNEA
jgi:hypothetical protein